MISEITALKRIIVVIGMYNLNPGLSKTISPGNLPKGIFETKGQNIPVNKIMISTIIRILCIELFNFTN